MEKINDELFKLTLDAFQSTPIHVHREFQLNLLNNQRRQALARQQLPYGMFLMPLVFLCTSLSKQIYDCI
jgi:hypothetical protein